MSGSEAGDVPRQVLLFSGHMIDAPGRKEPRFPPHQDKEDIAADAIAARLRELDAGAADLAICGGACGGDLLFAEACLRRGMRLELYIPFDEATFLTKSVDFADKHERLPGAGRRPTWRERFYAAKAKATLHVAPDELGPLRPDEDPYERNNLRMLNAARRFGADKVAFIALWNGEGGDGPGGTQHLMQEVGREAGRVHWIDTRQLWG